MNQPLVVNLGVGRDSTAVLVGLHQRGIRPDLIIFSDTGAEHQETYDYIPILNKWLASVGFPQITIVRYVATKFFHWPPYYTLEENCLTNCTLPGISFGPASCSGKQKGQAIHRFIREWSPAKAAWSEGLRVKQAIGFEHSPHEYGRSKSCTTFAIKKGQDKWYELWFPLQEWGWDLNRCIEEIKKAGLPVPRKSSCFFCLSMKPWEVDALPVNKLKRIVVLEARAKKRLRTCEGLWRSTIKGCRGAIPRPGSMTKYIRDKGLLPPEEVDRLITATPTEFFSKADFDRLGYSSWQDWLNAIINPTPQPVEDNQLLMLLTQ